MLRKAYKLRVIYWAEVCLIPDQGGNKEINQTRTWAGKLGKTLLTRNRGSRVSRSLPNAPTMWFTPPLGHVSRRESRQMAAGRKICLVWLLTCLLFGKITICITHFDAWRINNRKFPFELFIRWFHWNENLLSSLARKMPFSNVWCSSPR